LLLFVVFVVVVVVVCCCFPPLCTYVPLRRCTSTVVVVVCLLLFSTVYLCSTVVYFNCCCCRLFASTDHRLWLLFVVVIALWVGNCTLLCVRKFFLREIFLLKRYHWTRQPALLMTFGTNTLYFKYEPRYVKLIGIRILLFETRLL